jgi:SagB-type dehydrogenase family enzyme
LIVSFRATGKVRLCLPWAKRVLTADAVVLQILGAVCEEDDSQLSRLREQYSQESLDEAIERLADLGVLVAEHDSEGLPHAWSDWGEAAWFPHLMTRDVPYLDPDAAAAHARARLSAGQASPSPYKCLCDRALEVHQLPRPTMLSKELLADALLRRRTSRYFRDEPCTEQELADILFYTGGMLLEQEVEDFGRVVMKCSPSPGARHPTEVYCVIRNGGELLHGVYHYCSKDHALVLLRDRRRFDVRAFLDEALVGQDWFAGAPLVFFFTCVRDRLAWKYPSPRAYRVAHLECGHYCQTLVLAGTCLGLGTFETAALADSTIEAALGIDGSGEFVMYAAGVGHPRVDVRYATRTLRVSEYLPAEAQVSIFTTAADGS